ncbi:MAG: hypothetical protein MZW92_56415 [Comamonadaceae bacterium]|nr:hypothetical protein [Comamonadaceae bacterium]
MGPEAPDDRAGARSRARRISSRSARERLPGEDPREARRRTCATLAPPMAVGRRARGRRLRRERAARWRAREAQAGRSRRGRRWPSTAGPGPSARGRLLDDLRRGRGAPSRGPPGSAGCRGAGRRCRSVGRAPPARRRRCR